MSELFSVVHWIHITVVSNYNTSDWGGRGSCIWNTIYIAITCYHIKCNVCVGLLRLPVLALARAGDHCILCSFILVLVESTWLAPRSVDWHCQTFLHNLLSTPIEPFDRWWWIACTESGRVAMGSSLSSRIRTAVVRNDGDGLQTLMQLPFVRATDAVNLPLNRRQDGALALAIRLGRYDLISLLLDAGAKVSHHFCLTIFFITSIL